MWRQQVEEAGGNLDGPYGRDFGRTGTPPMEGFEKFVDVSLGTISWAFLPIILFTGILLSPDFAAGRPIRIGAQSRDPLASPALERRAASGDAASTSAS